MTKLFPEIGDTVYVYPYECQKIRDFFHHTLSPIPFTVLEEGFGIYHVCNGDNYFSLPIRLLHFNKTPKLVTNQKAKSLLDTRY